MAEKSDLKVERVKNYLVVSRPLGQERSLHAEYNTHNGNVRIYLYRNDVAVKAFYDDDCDGTIETLVVRNCLHHREHTKERKWLFFKSEETKELERMFTKADEDFEGYIAVLNLKYLIAQVNAELEEKNSKK